MLRVLTCVVRPVDLPGRLGGGLRRFVEVAARIHRFGVRYVVIESEPFLSSFRYFRQARELSLNYDMIGVHLSFQAAANRLVIGSMVFWLKVLALVFVAARTVKTSKVQLIVAPGETLAEVFVAWACAKLTRRPGAIVVQSDQFLHLRLQRVNGVRSAYAAYRTLHCPVVAFLAALIAQLHIRAMNDMKLLVVGSSLMKVLQVRGITSLAMVRIENGVDLRMIDAVQPSKSRFGVVYVGRVDISKGIEDLLRAWSRSDIIRNRYTLAIVGPSQKSLRKQIEALEASSGGRLNFLGALTDVEVLGVLKSSGVLVLPSSFESFSLVVAEALACGIPVVAYDSPGVREFFPTPAVSMVPRGDITGLISAVEALLGNPDDRMRLGRAGRKFVSRYNWDEVAAKEAEIYRNIVESQR